jgi:hypothetical protein
MADAIAAELFTPHIGKAASLPDGRKLTLTAVDQQGSQTSGAPHAFTLLLRGAPDRIVPEGLHRLTFERGESLDLYLIPIHTRSRDHQDYQIIFN